MAGGYMNRAYDVDLSSGRIAELTIPAAVRDLYLGGKGIGTRLLYDYTAAGLEPFSEEMVLIFSTGPVTGSAAPQSNRFVVSTKSPLTGAVANSTCGGSFATALKRAGVDLLLVRGRAAHPVYLRVTEEGVTIEDGRELWGKGTLATQAALPKAFGKAVIGPAGENLVRYAGIVSGDRIAARTGCGAVMGYKRLKAVIAHGERKLPIDDPDAHKVLQRATNKFLRGHPMTGKKLPNLGTANIVAAAAGRNVLPVHNFQRGSDPRAPQISGELLADRYLKKRVGCISCPIICGRGVEPVAELEGGAGAKVTKGPEYETLGLLGSNIGCFDLEKIFEWNELCDDLGMDTISAGGTIGFATELTQRGMLRSDLSFEHHEGISDLLRDIALRRGLGDELAEGVRRLSEKYGGHEFAIHVKGLELAAYDPRGCVGQGLEYATTNRGGCHVQGATMYLEAIGPISIDPLSPKAKAPLVIMQQNTVAAVSSSVYCVFSTYSMMPSVAFELDPQGLLYKAVTTALLHSGPLLAAALRMKTPIPVLWLEKFLGHVIGRRISMGDYLEIGERVFNMERLYNLREGFTFRDDVLPPRMLHESTFPGVEGGVPLHKMVPDYYRLRGWDREGVPTVKTLRRLALEV
jgi:aldehyde:ferredoxin oxidoreductase